MGILIPKTACSRLFSGLPVENWRCSVPGMTLSDNYARWTSEGDAGDAIGPTGPRLGEPGIRGVSVFGIEATVSDQG